MPSELLPRNYYEQGLVLAGERGDHAGLAAAQLGLGQTAVLQGDDTLAESYLWEVLHLCETDWQLVHFLIMAVAELLPFLDTAVAHPLAQLLAAQPAQTPETLAKVQAYLAAQDVISTPVEQPQITLSHFVSELLRTRVL